MAANISPAEFQKAASKAYQEIKDKPKPTFEMRKFSRQSVRRKTKRVFDSIKTKVCCVI